MTTPYTPLTDGGLEALEAGNALPPTQRTAAAEIRALRAERDDLLAALKGLVVLHPDTDDDGDPSEHQRMMGEHSPCSLCAALAAIARAEGRAEG